MKIFFKKLGRNAFLLSLCLHLFLFAWLARQHFSLKNNDMVDIEILPPKPSVTVTPTQPLTPPKGQIVEEDKHRINNEIDPNTHFLSRYNQRVVTQTKAHEVGKFQNTAHMGATAKAVAQKPAEKVGKAMNTPGKPLTLADLSPRFDWTPRGDGETGGVTDPGAKSQTDDYLKMLKEGPQTLLSSREFVYYTYYSRIKARLRLFWEPKIREKVRRLLAEGRHIASDDDHITRLIIILDRAGTLMKVQVQSASGVTDLDDAAIEAFKAAAPFPNPPHGLVGADGTVKIAWDFILQA